jgi:hypothetical protein
MFAGSERVLAGGSRERSLMYPQLAVFSYDPIDRHRSGNSREQTFPGAACYATVSSAMVFRAIMRAVSQRSKAAPLQALQTANWKLLTPHLLNHRHSLLSGYYGLYT